jgi:cell division protein ZapA
MESNKVNVRIYGQEYTISGEKSRDQIMKIADYVDSRMNELGKRIPGGPVTALAVLSAVNIAEEYFDEIRKQNQYENEISRLRRDAHQFEQLWEEAKKSFSHFKEDLALANQKNEELTRLLEEKSKEMEVNSSEEQYKELESSFFDLQMENIRLKGELEKLRS